MQIKRLSVLVVVMASTAFAQASSSSMTISSNKTGKQGDYYYEYWKDNGSGSMTLGENCNFSCTWGSVGNILFRKGVRPGARNTIVTYTADYKPTGNSYLSIYGWFKNPLVEYYIIESWGSWKPPGSAGSKGTITTDSGTYDIYQNSRTGPSIEGNGTFQQYWSVRREKHTSGVITCGNHFTAWESKGMKIGTMYEVSFNVEAYQSSGGSADVKVKMTTGNSGVIDGSCDGSMNMVLAPAGNNAPFRVFNPLGRKIAERAGGESFAGQNFIMVNPANRANGGVYYFPAKQGGK
jgi:endo-1,4-beta-xylanase